MSMARATLSGIVQSEPEKRFTPNNAAVSNFTILVQPAMRNETPFTVRVTCWRQLAETVSQSIHVGDSVLVEGRLQVHQYDVGGTARRSYELDASSVFTGALTPIMGSEGMSAGSGGDNFAGGRQPMATPAQAQMMSQTPQPAAVGAPAQMSPAYMPDESITEDDIPF